MILCPKMQNQELKGKENFFSKIIGIIHLCYPIDRQLS